MPFNVPVPPRGAPLLLHLLLLLSASALACSSDPSTSADASAADPDGGTPGELPLAPLVTAEQLAEALPPAANGEPILAEVGGVALTIGAARHDALSAAAQCTDLVSACVIATRELDGCVERLPECTSAEPWNEPTTCCAKACKDAYRAERRLDAPPLDAHDAVFGSTHECFPGLQDLYRAAGGDPYLAPRRASR